MLDGVGNMKIKYDTTNTDSPHLSEFEMESLAHHELHNVNNQPENEGEFTVSRIKSEIMDFELDAPVFYYPDDTKINIKIEDQKADDKEHKFHVKYEYEEVKHDATEFVPEFEEVILKNEKNDGSCKSEMHYDIIDANPVPLGEPDRAAQTVPKGILELRLAPLNDSGIYTLVHFEKGVQFGPYEGKLNKVASTEGYSWKLKNGQLVDESDETASNYLRYINCARNISERNLESFQCNGEIYYRTCRDVDKNEELLIYFENNSDDVYYKPQEENVEVKIYTCQFCHIGIKGESDRDKHQRFCRLGASSQSAETVATRRGRVDNKAAERSRLNRERHREEINQRRRDIRQRQQNSHQIHTSSNVQNTDEIEEITQATSNNHQSSNSYKNRHQRYYQKHKEEINKRKRDKRQKQNISRSIPTTAAERNRKYRERNKQEINERRRNIRRLRQQNLQVDNRAAERSRLYRERHREEINRRRRDIRQSQRNLHQKHTASNVQNTDEIAKHKRDRRRIYRERHRQEINERRRNKRQLIQQNLQRIRAERNINNINAIEQITKNQCRSVDKDSPHLSALEMEPTFDHAELFNVNNQQDNEGECTESRIKSEIMDFDLDAPMFYYPDAKVGTKINIKIEDQKAKNNEEKFHVKDDEVKLDVTQYFPESFEIEEVLLKNKECKPVVLMKNNTCEYGNCTTIRTSNAKTHKDERDCCNESYDKSVVKSHPKLAQKTVFQCADCAYRTYYKSNINRHRNVQHERKIVFKCTDCDYETYDNSQINRHRRFSHKQRTMFKCAECDYETYNNSRINRHRESKHKQKIMFKCTDCDYETDDKFVMKKHRNNKHVFKCADCDYETFDKATMKKHRNFKHEQTKLFTCADCDFKTYDQTRIYRHRRIKHKQKKLFECVDCDYKTNYKYCMNRHKIVKHEQKNLYECAECDYKTYNIDNMKRHKSSKHERKNVFKCADCDYQAYYKYSMNYHRNTKHNRKTCSNAKTDVS